MGLSFLSLYFIFMWGLSFEKILNKPKKIKVDSNLVEFESNLTKLV